MRRSFRLSFSLCLLAACAALLPGAGCARRHISADPPAPHSPSVRFVDITRQSGIAFVHNTGARGKKYMPETIGSGVAVFDYDNDGNQDLLFVNSRDWPGVKSARDDTMHLYRGNGNATWTDVTRAAGLAIRLYGMGVAVGDYDNDGHEDIYIAALGANHLFRNTSGDAGHRPDAPIFVDATRQAGVAGAPVAELGLTWKWSSGAAWLDYDRDGRLDLFVSNYVRWSPKLDIFCGKLNGAKQYCPPESYEGVACTLYHNEGGGRFRDVSAQTGIRTPRTIGKSFGIAVADFNGDNWPDIAVANDTWPNFLFLNQGGKGFIERGVESGIGFDDNGQARAGMGIDAADWNNDGHFGLLVGNFSAQGLSLFQNESADGEALFSNVAPQNNVAAASLNFLTFGLFVFDYDLNGLPDLFTANGHIDELVKLSNSMVSYKERPLLFRNVGNGRFDEVGVACGLTEEVIGRGAAYGDLDNDGDLDIVMNVNGGPARVWRNDGGNRSHWIRFRTVGTRSNRDGIGALIRVTADGRTQSQRVHSGGSFVSESQREPTFGLGAAARAEKVEVRWPSGRIDRFGPLAADRQYVSTEGQGMLPDSHPSLPTIKEK